MTAVSNKLKNSFQGALAGGGDPATSPLYVFGPFLKLIVIAGVAQITYGVSLWLAVLTIAVVSAMYRLVMQWITDGSGGSGLSEEEFGGWAVKINAAITFIEYTLTFLVSMSAMVTFLADRLTFLNIPFLGLPFISYRTLVAILLSILTGWLVNRGPKMAARTFGPATGGVLVLLWLMVFSAIIKHGFHLPTFHLQAFNSSNLQYTLGGYVRILAVMTGIEVFANLVAAYSGTPAQKSKKAFTSLLIIMGTTAVTMLILGPVIYSVADPTNAEVSVFTQTMDDLLPQPLPYLGTLISVAVLMSASAASAQGLQNLFLGLKERRYVPPRIGQPNRYEVADIPVWIEVGIVGFCFLFFGTSEDIYLAIYAAGVFIIIINTGLAVTKRLIRKMRKNFSFNQGIILVGTSIAAILTTSATITIFVERFFAGAWTYFLFIPALYLLFSYFRSRYGEPTPEMDYLGQLDAAHLAGFGFGQGAKVPILPGETFTNNIEFTWQPDQNGKEDWRDRQVSIQEIAVLLDGSENAAQALPLAISISRHLNARLTLLSAIKKRARTQPEQFENDLQDRQKYLDAVAAAFQDDPPRLRTRIYPGSIIDATKALNQERLDLVITSTRGASGKPHWLSRGISHKLVEILDTPVILVPITELGSSSEIRRIQVALDGSIYSERVLPYARILAKKFDSELLLLSVPAVPEVKDYRAAADIVEKIRHRAETNMRKFLTRIARALRKDNLDVHVLVTGSIPAHTIIERAEISKADMIMLSSQGRGGYNAMLLGSVLEQVVQEAQVPVFIVPIQEPITSTKSLT
jgi:nucleotide-binding universal stress UspA family protein/amino acid transporter